MAEGKLGTIREDGHRPGRRSQRWGKWERQNRARGQQWNFCAKRIGLVGLEGEQHGIVMEFAGYGPSVERERRSPGSRPEGDEDKNR